MIGVRMANENFTEMLVGALQGEKKQLDIFSSIEIEELEVAQVIEATETILSQQPEYPHRSNALYLGGLAYKAAARGLLKTSVLSLSNENVSEGGNYLHYINTAISYFEEAIQLKNGYAMYARGDLCDRGIGGPKDQQRALELYRQAAALDNTSAIRSLASKYYRGEIVDADYFEAFRLYKRAMELGDTEAITEVAWMYQHGQGIDRDELTALFLYEKAAQLGDRLAKKQFSLMCIKHNLKNPGINYTRVLEGIAYGFEAEKEFLLELRANLPPKFKNINGIRELIEKIETMREYGEKLSKAGCSKGKMINNLTNELDKRLDIFIIKCIENVPSRAFVAQFKEEFAKVLVSQNTAMYAHRKQWKPIITNILIALTGIGIIAIIVKTSLEGVRAYQQNRPIFSFNQSLFFAKPNSQKHCEEIGESLGKLDIDACVMRNT